MESHCFKDKNVEETKLSYNMSSATEKSTYNFS